LEFTLTRYFFHTENDFNGFLDPKNLGKDNKFITPKTDADSYIGCKCAADILDAILNHTFLPHIWNVYPSFINFRMGPLQGSRVKIRGHMIAHRIPLNPRTSGYDLDLRRSVRHKSVIYRNSRTNRAGFLHGSFIRPILHCFIRKFGYL